MDKENEKFLMLENRGLGICSDGAAHTDPPFNKTPTFFNSTLKLLWPK